MSTSFGPFGLGARLKRARLKQELQHRTPEIWVRKVHDDWVRHMSSLDPGSNVVLWRRTAVYVLPRSQPGDFVAFVNEGVIVGIGLFDYSLSLPLDDAWDEYGAALGLRDRGEFLHRAGSTSGPNEARYTRIVTCRVVSDIRWLDFKASLLVEDLSLARPGTPLCSTASHLGQKVMALWHELGLKQDGFRESSKPTQIESVSDGPFRSRPGQKRFQSQISKNFGGRCVVSDEPAAPTLTAAHIHTFSLSRNHDVTNGLLLRSDLRTLFDDGYWTIDHFDCVRFSDHMLEHYPGTGYVREFNGRKLTALERVPFAPHPAALEWHRTQVYRA